MSAITYISDIPRYNISTIISVDLFGNTTDITESLYATNLLTISSIAVTNLSSITSFYVPNLSSIQEQSTIESIQSYFDRSSARSLSTSQGIMDLPITPTEKISTLIALSTNSFIVSLDDILEEANTYLTTENNNKHMLQNLNYDLLKTNIITWAKQGFSDSYPVYQLPVTLPPGDPTQLIRCSDGGLRNIWEYIEFFLGSSMQSVIDEIHAKLDGITLTYSVQANPYIVVLHATRKA